MTSTWIEAPERIVTRVESATKPRIETITSYVSKPYVAPEHLFDGAERIVEIEGVPVTLLDLYAEIAKRHALTREISEGQWVSTVAGLKGAYGEGATQTEAQADLCEAVKGWVLIKRRIGASDIPLMEGLDLNLTARSSNVEISSANETA